MIRNKKILSHIQQQHKFKVIKGGSKEIGNIGVLTNNVLNLYHRERCYGLKLVEVTDKSVFKVGDIVYYKYDRLEFLGN